METLGQRSVVSVERTEKENGKRKRMKKRNRRQRKVVIWTPLLMMMMSRRIKTRQQRGMNLRKLSLPVKRTNRK